jgi:hypothetical protein
MCVLLACIDLIFFRIGKAKQNRPGFHELAQKIPDISSLPACPHDLDGAPPGPESGCERGAKGAG